MSKAAVHPTLCNVKSGRRAMFDSPKFEYVNRYTMAELNIDNTGVFSDSDDEHADAHDALSRQIQTATVGVFRVMTSFLSEPKYINPPRDPTTNIVDRGSRRCYNIPDPRIPKFFKLMEGCRKQGIRLMMYEKQLPVSGIMLDFDIKQRTEDKVVGPVHFHKLCELVTGFLVKHLDYSETTEIIVGFTEKPKIVYNEDEGYYKSGFHMLIPGPRSAQRRERFCS